MKDLSVITVTHQSAGFIEDQIFSVVSGGLKISMEHIVVDNGSSDGTVGVLRGLTGLVKVIENGENVGFAAANNRGLEEAQGRYLLYLNPDMRVQEGSLDYLVEWMDAHPEAGISSCLLVDVMGRPLSTSRPRELPRVWNEMLWLLRLGFLCRVKESQEMVKGAFMLVRRELVDRLGFAFDPRYFLLYEDTDLCREVKRLGLKVAYHPQIWCVDFNSRSFATKSGEWIYRCFTQGMLTYFKKWEPWYRWIWIALLIPVGYVLRRFK